MILEVNKLNSSKQYISEEEVSFDADTYKCILPLIAVNSCSVTIKANRYDDFIEVMLCVKADLTLQSSYTLKPFNYELKTEEEYHFSSYQEDADDDFIIYKGNIIHLDELIFNLISASIPMAPKAPGETLQKVDGSVRVMSEEDYLKEKAEAVDPRFAKLDDLDID